MSTVVAKSAGPVKVTIAKAKAKTPSKPVETGKAEAAIKARVEKPKKTLVKRKKAKGKRALGGYKNTGIRRDEINDTHLCIPRLPLRMLVRNISRGYYEDVRFSEEAMYKMHMAAETYVSKLISDANAVRQLTGGLMTLMPSHIATVLVLDRNNPQVFPSSDMKELLKAGHRAKPAAVSTMMTVADLVAEVQPEVPKVRAKEREMEMEMMDVEAAAVPN